MGPFPYVTLPLDDVGSSLWGAGAWSKDQPNAALAVVGGGSVWHRSNPLKEGSALVGHTLVLRVHV